MSRRVLRSGLHTTRGPRRSSQKSGNTAFPGVSCLFSFLPSCGTVASATHTTTPSLRHGLGSMWCSRRHARLGGGSGRTSSSTPTSRTAGRRGKKTRSPAAPGAPSGAPCRPPAPTTGCNSKLSRHRRSERKSRARLWESAQPRAPRTGASTARAAPKPGAWRGTCACAVFVSAGVRSPSRPSAAMPRGAHIATSFFSRRSA